MEKRPEHTGNQGNVLCSLPSPLIWFTLCDRHSSPTRFALPMLPACLLQVLRRYHIQDREDYVKYNRLVGHVTSLAAKLKTLSSTDPFRVKMTSQLLSKLQSIGVIDTEKSLIKAEQLTVSAFCRYVSGLLALKSESTDCIARPQTNFILIN
eukprot:TRINITY_DN2223_c0_g1_i1.p1 TRINITY_DN2223_c0_g1~~TRINITY_DN2223_c0_g1_i1.p1  ORF type:complete len:152 (+),score=12.86 TRINITY_DN2223_c0_g1_i1:123-578(+)